MHCLRGMSRVLKTPAAVGLPLLSGSRSQVPVLLRLHASPNAGSEKERELHSTTIRRYGLKKGEPVWRRRALTNSDQEYSTLQDLKTDLKEKTNDENVVSDGKKVACEFVIQAMFNFLSCSAVAQAVKMSAGDAMLQTGLVMGAHAIILPLVIYSAMETSGAHFNPMVTACFVALGKLPLKVGLAYVVAQLAGGIVGAAAAFSSLPPSMQTLAYAGVQAVPATSTVPQAFMGEVYASFALIFVLCATNLDPRCKWGKFAPLSIPMIICLLMWIVGPVSSMCINPARAAGPAVLTGFWEHHWIWWTAPFIGGLSAAKIYQKILLPKGVKL